MRAGELALPLRRRGNKIRGPGVRPGRRNCHAGPRGDSDSPTYPGTPTPIHSPTRWAGRQDRHQLRSSGKARFSACAQPHGDPQGPVTKLGPGRAKGITVYTPWSREEMKAGCRDSVCDRHLPHPPGVGDPVIDSLSCGSGRNVPRLSPSHCTYEKQTHKSLKCLLSLAAPPCGRAIVQSSGCCLSSFESGMIEDREIGGCRRAQNSSFKLHWPEWKRSTPVQRPLLFTGWGSGTPA